MSNMAYFPTYFSYARTLSALSDEQFGRVIRAAIEYAENGTIPELDAMEMMGFAFVREDIDRANDNYKKVCEANRSNVQKRWDKKKNDTTVYDGIRTNTNEYGRMNGISVDTNAYETYQSKGKGKSESNSNSNSERESISASDDAKPARAKKSGKKFVPPTVDEVAAYCKEKGLNTIDPEYFVRFYSESDWIKANGEPVRNWKSTVLTWAQRDKERGITAKPEKHGSFDTDEFFAAALERSYREMEEIQKGKMKS